MAALTIGHLPEEALRGFKKRADLRGCARNVRDDKGAGNERIDPWNAAQCTML
jgi:hypothetical protein